MCYDGVVIKLQEKLFLVVLNPETNEFSDGINISEHECYKDLKNYQIYVVSVIFKDGTLEMDNIDLDEFIYGDKYGDNNIFIHIKDRFLYSISNINDPFMSWDEEPHKSMFTKIARNCIMENNKNDFKNI